MENAFKSIMAGGDDDARARAREFADRVTTGNPLEGFDDNDVAESRNILASLSPEQRKNALRASMQNLNSNISASDRSSLNEMLKQRQAGQGMVDITRSGENVAPGSGGEEGGGGLGGLLGGLLGGGSSGGGGGGGGGLGDILGGLLGGGGGGGSSQSGGDLDDILGGLLGGGGSSQSGGGLDDLLGGLLGGGGAAQAPAQEQAGFLDNILGSQVGKAIIAGAAAYAMKELL